VIANISQVKALKQALASSTIALEATQAGFEVGTRTAVDVLDSQRELFRAKRNYARARYDYILETLRLKQAAGLLTETDIVQINSWLD
jgi:outer membrane protein